MSQTKNYTGLTDREVADSRSKHGINILTPPEKIPEWKLFLEKFRDPLIIILLVAGLLSIGISFYEYFFLGHGTGVFFEPIGIFVAIFLATGLGFIFERKADKEFAILNQVNDDEPVQVIRNGNATRVPRRDVVVGDVIIISTGEEIPADARLLEAVEMNVDESSLTGEPMCRKTVDPDHFDSEATFPSDMVMRGSKVMEGHGIARVTAVGDATENGKVFEAAQIEEGVKTPLSEQLDRLGRFVSVASYIIGGLVIAGRIIMYFVEQEGTLDWIDFIAYFLQSVMLAVTLIVVAVPEGLPMAVTLSLAYSMRRMLKTNNLVRKMHACETMGATTVICTDKTGTLTQNRMQVARVDFFGLGDTPDASEEWRLVLDGIAVNSTARLDRTHPEKPEVLGNPTEGALLLWLDSQGLDYQRMRDEVTRMSEIPFSTERKYMATVIRNGAGQRVLYVKGAPEIVMDLCAGIGGRVTREEIKALLLGYQQQAMRTLGFAYQVLDEGEEGIADGSIAANRLVFAGITAISDPVREDVPDAVSECRSAGIDIKIVTGDTPATAKEIGRQIGLWTDADGDLNIATGPEVGSMSDEELRDRVADLKIIARARPMDKKRLVEALQSNGDVVAVTGDGTNDAPALKTAHVGLSMGDGTSVAKEVSDITIIDNSFSSIGRAVMWGRSLYKNLQRFILFQLTVNVAACLVVLVGSFMGTAAPLTVTQMLWVNLVMDTFAAMALSSLAPSRSVMHDKPRNRRDFILTPSMDRSILGVGLAFFVVLIGILYVFEHARIESMADFLHLHLGAYKGLSPYEESLFFTIFVMLQFWNMFNARAWSTGASAFRLKGCGEFVMIAAVVFVGQILIVEFGGEFFNVEPLSLSDWLVIVIGTSPVLLVGELMRSVKHHK